VSSPPAQHSSHWDHLHPLTQTIKQALIALVTTITDLREASAAELARAYHQRWEHETGNGQLKTALRGPGQVLRSQSPALVEQELWGYLLTPYARACQIFCVSLGSRCPFVTYFG
jgi:hypothetical protein